VAEGELNGGHRQTDLMDPPQPDLGAGRAVLEFPSRVLGP